MPARVLIDRLPVPLLVFDSREGGLVVANEPFAAMLGYSPTQLQSLSIFHILLTPAVTPASAILAANAGEIVELEHAEGWVVKARMSGSVLLRKDDRLAVVAFEDLTEHFWDTKPGDEKCNRA